MSNVRVMLFTGLLCFALSVPASAQDGVIGGQNGLNCEPDPEAKRPRVISASEGRVSVVESPFVGPKHAKVTIAAYLDYQ